MRLRGRLITIAAGAAVVAGAVALGGGGAPAGSQPAPVAAASTLPCIPNAGPPGRLPTPPVIDANVRNAFTLYVLQGATTTVGGSPQDTFCYVTTPGAAATYVEAPTIHIRQGGTFTMTLVNQIPYTGPSPVPTPQSTILTTPDKCAWLPFDGTFPSPNPSASPSGYFNHARVTTDAMPPWMLDNDTNFHTHGWHVSPYVDNVYKSLVWAPTPNTCVFTFSVRQSQPPGSYWYHAHLHGLSDDQVGGGLAGTLIVDPAPPVSEPPAVVLLVKNYQYAQTGPGTALRLGAAPAMAGMHMRTGTAGRPERARHYNALVASAHRNGPLALGVAPAASPVAYPAFSPPPWNSGMPWPSPAPAYCKAQPTSAGNVGDPMTVNGALIPVVLNGQSTPAVGPRVLQTVGTVRRYRVLNATSDSYLNLETVTDAGTVVPLAVVARDGVPVNWNFETSRVDPSKPGIVVEPNVYVPPSGRVDIVVRETGRPLTIISAPSDAAHRSASGYPFCNGYFGSPVPRRNIVRINPFVGPAGRRFALAAAAVPVQQHRALSAAATLVLHDLPRVTKSRAITFTMYPEGCCNWNVTQTGVANGANPPPSVKALAFTERPFWLAPRQPINPNYPYVPWVQVHKNDVEEWYLYNATGEIHAFHIHQLTFVALDSPFEATNPYQQVFLDSIALPAGMLTNTGVTPSKGSYPLITPSLTKILIDFRNVDPGVFVFHCHMLFHEDHGMMGVVEVLPPVIGR